MGNRKSLFIGSFVMAVLFASLFLGWDVARAEQSPSPEQNAIESRKKTKPQIKEKPAGKAKTAKGTQNETAEAGKSGVTGTQSEPERPQPELDRRWIIKMKDEKDRKIPARKPVAIAWAGKDQQTRCEAYLPGLQDAFSKTRYYSVGGDGCNTAGSARAFLDLVRNCEGDCPQGFLEAKGYSRRIIRNVEILNQLGQKRCTESVRETGPVTSGKKTEKKAAEKPIR